jgi:hypothetical protein
MHLIKPRISLNNYAHTFSLADTGRQARLSKSCLTYTRVWQCIPGHDKKQPGQISASKGNAILSTVALHTMALQLPASQCINWV